MFSYGEDLFKKPQSGDTSRGITFTDEETKLTPENQGYTPVQGDTWLDNGSLKIFDGSDWKIIGGVTNP